MDFGVELLPNESLDKLKRKGIQLEKAGLDEIWVADHFNHRNIYCVLSILAANTSSVSLGTGITNPYVIHPAETASAIQTINEASDGRAKLGIGAGDKFTLNKIGLDWDKPLQRVKESVYIIRELTKNNNLECGGEFYEMDSGKLSFHKSEVPIYVGGQGPKMLSLGGEIGEGVLVNASHKKDLEFAIDKIGNKDTDIAPHTCFSIAENRERARKKTKPVVSYVVSNIPEKVIEKHGLSKKRVNKISDCIKKGDTKKAINHVSSKMIDVFSISGTLDDCINKISNLNDLEIDHIVLGSPLGPNYKESLKLIEEGLIPSFK
ncbi:MAG: Coenzyme F420-dependent N5N10-methylene tetrahydromethanopterin reductase Mer [Candidatus Methanohalarchaeum thermophilum]|uniref:5,10-methylenetetrahydromethanopterin reductase n=1 Tax=Methanohalarchaeum thermophilum TaxID=1903181 RepID=A0A1Q6DTI9_METT1|nr:MAG: Coenzyme F420-dependent N5N10-methylene tetrahydromethanopterin reductase Mer [Candidatus Methanohalarchaeum thermophilum]